MIRWSTVKHAKDNVCEPHQGSFERLFKHLDMARARALRSPSTEKINGRGLVPASFHEGVHPEKPVDYPGVQRWRKLELVDRVWLLILDIDDATCDIEVILEAWTGYALIHWSTYSHGVEGHALRMRVVLPYSRPLSEHEHRLVYRWACNRMHTAGVEEAAVTTKTIDPTRVMFGPGNVSPKSTTAPWFELVEGTMLDVDALPGGQCVAKLATEAVKRATRKRPIAPPTRPDGLHPYVEKALAAECDNVSQAVKGGRGTAVFTAAAQLGELVAGGALNESTARAHLAAAGAASGIKDKEIERNITRGLAKGAKSPRRPPESNIVPFRRSTPEKAVGVEDLHTKAVETVEIDAEEEPEDYIERATVTEVLKGAPISADAKVPMGFALTARGTWLRKIDKHGEFDGWQRAAHGPVLITAALEDDGDDTVVLRVSFRRRWHWRHIFVPRGATKSTRGLIDLSNQDLPVDQSTAHALVKYISAFEAENENVIPRLRCARALGWQCDDTFLLGSDILDADPGKWPADAIVYRGETPGERQAAASTRTNGTVEGWSSSIAVMEDYPSLRLALYAALAAPMLRILGATSFAIDWSYDTSAGKSTCLRLAASVWGSPEGRNRFRHSWNNTRVGIERLAGALSDLPLILDDTMRAGNKAIIGPLIYEITDEQGRTRGSVQGLANRVAWRTILLSTGEQPAVSFTKDGGARARVISLWGIPLKRQNSAQGAIAKQIKHDLIDHHGHVGPMFVKYLESQREQWPAWRERFREVEREFHDLAGDHAIAIRLAEAFAVLDVTASAAHKVLPLPFEYAGTAETIRQIVMGELEETDLPLDALRSAVDWALANQHRFLGRADEKRPPGQGWAGRWDTSKREINWFPDVLAEVLSSRDHNAGSTLKLWRDRGWLNCEGRRLTRLIRTNVKDGRSRTRCNCLNELALDLVSPPEQEGGDASGDSNTVS